MSGLPKGWALSTVGEVGELRLGKQRSPKWHTGPNMRPYLRVANVFEDRIDISDVKQMHFESHEVEVFELQPGDVLLNEGQTPELLGRPAIYRGELPGACFTNSLIRFRPHPGVLNTWALAVFRRHMHSGRFRRESQITTNIAHLSRGRLARVEFPVPPAAEQERIVAAVDEQFSRLEAGVIGLQRVCRSATVLREAAISAWLPSRVNSERLVDICDAFSDCEHRTPKYADKGFPALRPRDVVGGRLDLDNAARVEAVEFELQARRHVPKPGDIVYSRELSYGWATVIPDGVQLCLSQGMVVFRPSSRVLPQYLAAILNSGVGRTQAHAAATGSAHPHINIGNIKSYQVPVPSIELQAEIAGNIERITSMIEAALASIAQSSKRATALRHNILKEAVSGRLVSQDPNDESMSELLARAAADRASAPEADGRQGGD